MFASQFDFNLAIGQQLDAWKVVVDQWASLRREPEGPPILVTGAYRSGTSWVGQMLAGKGIWHLHEPFNPRFGLSAKYFNYQRPEDQNEYLDQVVTGLLSGKLIGNTGQFFVRGVRSNRLGMPARLGLYRTAIRRVLIKDPVASLLSAYLARNHGFVVVLVLRQPAGFVSSLKHLGWDTAEQLRNLITNDPLIQDWLWPFEKQISTACLSSGNLTHATLYACIWKVLVGFVKLYPERFLVVNYENLCSAPEPEFRSLYKSLNLNLHKEDIERHRLLTQPMTSRVGNSPYNVVRNTAECQRAWHGRLNSGEIQLVRSVWDSFEICHFQHEHEW